MTKCSKYYYVKTRVLKNGYWTGKLDSLALHDLNNNGFMCYAVDGGMYSVYEREV